MASHIIPTQTSTFTINESGDTWTLGAKASINVVGTFGIYEASDYKNNILNINGDITVASSLDTSPKYALLAQGSNTDINIGNHSEIKAEVVISLQGVNADLTNNGLIQGIETAIETTMDGAKISNRDTIEANQGVVVQAGQATILNDAAAKILGDINGVTNYAQESLTLVNKGVISGDTQSIIDYDGNSRITNLGTLEGNVALGNGNDRFDNRGGTLLGDVAGGGDNDTFLVDHSNINIVEMSGEGTDTVKSWASFTLDANVETLFLYGSANLNGTGESNANTLRGNAGNNRLMGLEGDDSLDGGRGNDRLIGGDDADTFIFSTGFDKDKVVDFVDGIDKIDISDLAAVTSFKDLKAHHVTFLDAGVLIEAGEDTLLIQHMTETQFSKGDFEI